MNSTSQLTTFDYALEKATLFKEVRDWMNSNTFSSDQCYIWQVGICTERKLQSIQLNVLRDIECKHFRCWDSISFKEAICILSALNKYNSVFKSELSDYTGKGQHIFMYKTTCSAKNMFYHTLHH